MSGYKRATVTISEQEYRRLHDADMKRRFRAHARTKPKSTGPSDELTGALEQMERRQQQLEEAFRELDQNSGHGEAEALQEILRQNALSYENLAAAIEETASNARDSVSELTQLFTERMHHERSEYQRNLNALIQRLDAHQEDVLQKEEHARHWLSRAVTLADFIEAEFDHERFLPGRLEGIHLGLQISQSNLAQGMHEASLQGAQQAFLQLSELHFELEQRIVEWQAEYDGAFQALQQVIAEMEMNASVNGIGLQGEELPDLVEVDFWTDGKYQELLDQCRGFRQLLEDEHDRISTEQLRRIREKLHTVTMQIFESIVYEARVRALSSQLRMNIAETALLAFEVHGFKLNTAGYADRDMRAPFTAYLDNEDGVQVTIKVLPTESSNQELTNDLVVVTEHPDLETEQAARLQWQEVCLTLSQYDLRVGRPEIRAAATPQMTEPEPTLPQPHLVRPASRLER